MNAHSKPGLVQPTKYKGFDALRLSSANVSLIVVPELGAKIVSLRDLSTGKEWLLDSGPRSLGPVGYGSDYIKADLSGWDECFPTINACPYPEEGPYKDRSLPDHGELWSVPWQAQSGDGTIRCSVEGRALPYAFRREIALIDDNAFRFDYSVENTGRETIAAFWTAHPLFAVTERTRIELPDGVKELLCVDGGKAMEKGARYAWPNGNGDGDGGSRKLDRIGPPSARDSRKFYSEAALPRGQAILRESDTGERISLAWSTEELPYFGFWIDEGEHTGASVCALEPCNGYYDSLTEAARQDKLLRIAPGESASWSLEVRIGK